MSSLASSSTEFRPVWERLAVQVMEYGVSPDLLTLERHQRAMVCGAIAYLEGVHLFKGGMAGLAEALQADRSGSRRCAEVMANAIPNMISDMWDGYISLAAGWRASILPHEDQERLLERLHTGMNIRQLLPVRVAPAPHRGAGLRKVRSLKRQDPHGVLLKKVSDTFRVTVEYTLRDITSLDSTVDYDTAREASEVFKKSASELARINKLLKERMTR